MARIDKSQSGARGGVGREVDGTRTTPRTEPTRSKVGLERPREGAREIEGGDLSAFDGRATNVAARPAGTRGQRTRRGSVDEGDRSTARSAPRRTRARPSAKSEPPTPRPPSPMGKSTPGQGTTTRPVRAGPARSADRSDTATDRDQRTSKSVPARATTARSARATRGGEERESTLDRSVSGARRAPAPRTNGAKKTPTKKGRAGNRDATS